MNEKELSLILERREETKKVLNGLQDKFAEEFEPKGTYPFYQEFADEFLPVQNQHNGLSFRLIREVLERQFGSEYAGIYPASGTDIATCQALGGKWFFIDDRYDLDPIIDRCKNIPSKKVREAGYTPLNHCFLYHGLPPEIKPGSLEVSLIKRPGEIDDIRTAWFAGLFGHAVTPLKQGGIMITEYHFEFLLDKLSEREKDVVRPFSEQMQRMKDLLGVPGLDSIGTFFYEQSDGTTVPWFRDFALYQKK
ncbi:hypothetical protein JW707_02360 [Candidatus Woesearchaeota archaeon]|nr:hypothetical protein [Candidatus Woesearchaeota archaeon]